MYTLHLDGLTFRKNPESTRGVRLANARFVEVVRVQRRFFSVAESLLRLTVVMQSLHKELMRIGKRISNRRSDLEIC